MALIWADGFERYANTTEMGKVWAGPANGLTTGRIQGTCCSMSGGSDDYGTYSNQGRVVPSGLGNAVSGYIGFGFRSTNTSESGFNHFELRDGYTVSGLHLVLRTEGGFLKLYRNSTLIATGGSIASNVWCYIEIYWNIHASTGTCTVKRDGATDINFTGNTYAGTGGAYVNTIGIGSGNYYGAVTYYDDMYISDSEFLGNFRTVRLTPSTAGDSTQWTPNTGTNVAAVDDTATDSDTTYVATSTTDSIDLYNLPSPTHGGTTILGVDVRYDYRKEVSDTNFAPVFKTASGTVQVGTTIPVTSASYVVRNVLQTTNPETGLAWTQGEIDGLQIGMKKLE
jgi:hypothetical protein